MNLLCKIFNHKLTNTDMLVAAIKANELNLGKPNELECCRCGEKLNLLDEEIYNKSCYSLQYWPHKEKIRQLLYLYEMVRQAPDSDIIQPRVIIIGEKLCLSFDIPLKHFYDEDVIAENFCNSNGNYSFNPKDIAVDLDVKLNETNLKLSVCGGKTTGTITTEPTK